MAATAIHTRFPDLDLPWLPLGNWPTPIARLNLPDPRGGALWIKDEGRCAPYGGNKVRKLEWILADAQRAHATDLLTTGATGSHHVIAVAHYAQPLGMRTHAVLIPQPDSAHALANAAAARQAATSIRTVASPLLVPVVMAWEWARLSRIGTPYVIGPGGSDALGTIGWTAGGLEIAAQIADLDIDQVVVACGSSGTVAGILLGLRLAGSRAEVVAVRVVDRIATSEFLIRRLARAAERRLAAAGAGPLRADLDRLRLVHTWFDGYGVEDDRTRAVAAEADALGVFVECTYTARSLGYALAAARAGARVLWVDTVHPGDPEVPCARSSP